MTLYLSFGSRDGEYDLDVWDLDEAIEEEARKLAASADADILEDCTDEEREELEVSVTLTAKAELRRPGDFYMDPTGVRWSLIERED